MSYETDKPKKSNRGFASMNKDEQRQIASWAARLHMLAAQLTNSHPQKRQKLAEKVVRAEDAAEPLASATKLRRWHKLLHRCSKLQQA